MFQTMSCSTGSVLNRRHHPSSAVRPARTPQLCVKTSPASTVPKGSQVCSHHSVTTATTPIAISMASYQVFSRYILPMRPQGVLNSFSTLPRHALKQTWYIQIDAQMRSLGLSFFQSARHDMKRINHKVMESFRRHLPFFILLIYSTASDETGMIHTVWTQNRSKLDLRTFEGSKMLQVENMWPIWNVIISKEPRVEYQRLRDMKWPAFYQLDSNSCINLYTLAQYWSKAIELK